MAYQTQNNETKREMLAAIREHLTASKPFDAVRHERSALHKVSAGMGEQQSAGGLSLPRNPQSTIGLVEQFCGSLEAINGHCLVVSDEGKAAEAVQRIVEQIKARHIAISNSPLVGRVIADLKIDGELFEQSAASALFATDVGITGAQLGVAETGTLVLESDREQHRFVSLVPPVHIALIESHQLRLTLAEALQVISENGQEGLSRAVTFITGPSRTSDIELTLAIGVHGPAELYVIIIERESIA